MNTCVCCGAIIPEGRQICSECGRTLLNTAYGVSSSYTKNFEIKKIIFNNPATIVYWADGTKTVVKAQKGDIFDPEKGLTMAFTKKALGNEGSYYNTIKKWTDKYEMDLFQRFLDTI